VKTKTKKRESVTRKQRNRIEHELGLHAGKRRLKRDNKLRAQEHKMHEEATATEFRNRVGYLSPRLVIVIVPSTGTCCRRSFTLCSFQPIFFFRCELLVQHIAEEGSKHTPGPAGDDVQQHSKHGQKRRLQQQSHNNSGVNLQPERDVHVHGLEHPRGRRQHHVASCGGFEDQTACPLGLSGPTTA
jgi:hypothetical protein